MRLNHEKQKIYMLSGKYNNNVLRCVNILNK